MYCLLQCYSKMTSQWRMWRLQWMLFHANHSCWVVSHGVDTDEKAFRLITIKQITRLEMLESHLWENHWCQTQHFRISIWVVNTKEDKTNPFHVFTSKPTVNEIGDKGATSLSRALVINHTLTVLNLASQLQKKAPRQMKYIHSSVFLPININRKQYRRNRNKVVVWCIDGKLNSYCA